MPPCVFALLPPANDEGGGRFAETIRGGQLLLREGRWEYTRIVPYVPSFAFPADHSMVTTGAGRAAILACGVSGVCFEPIEFVRVVEFDWEPGMAVPTLSMVLGRPPALECPRNLFEILLPEITPAQEFWRVSFERTLDWRTKNDVFEFRGANYVNARGKVAFSSFERAGELRFSRASQK